MRISDWSSDVCSSDLGKGARKLRSRSRLPLFQLFAVVDPRRAQGLCDLQYGARENRADPRSEAPLFPSSSNQSEAWFIHRWQLVLGTVTHARGQYAGRSSPYQRGKRATSEERRDGK